MGRYLCDTPSPNRSLTMSDAPVVSKTCPVENSPGTAWDAIPYFYLLRVQIISFLALLSFPFIALWFAPNLLLGIFDVTPLGMVFVTLAALLASWTVMVTTWQVLLYGPERFHLRPLPLRSPAFTELPSRIGHSPVFA